MASSSTSLHDLVVYHNAHVLRGSNPAQHIGRLESFLQNCTCDAVVLEQTVQVRSGLVFDPIATQPLIDAFNHRWGPAVEVLEVAGAEGKQYAYSWSPSLELDSLLSEISQFSTAVSRSVVSQLTVKIVIEFCLASQEGAKLDKQNWSRTNLEKDEFFLPHGFSRIWMNLGPSSALGALVSFPFTASDPSLIDYLMFFQRHFPVRMSLASKNWHWWKVRRDGSRYFRKAAITAMGGSVLLLRALNTAVQ